MTRGNNLMGDLKSALSSIGVSWEELNSRCKEIVLFGSRATGTSKKDSDWDLLCVGQGEDLKDDFVQLVFVKPEMLVEPHWLGSELAGHVSKYGLWLKGDGAWVRWVFGSDEAIKFKEKKISARVSGLFRSWKFLAEPYRERKAKNLRRDVQRLAVLREGSFVPSSQLLDSQWDGAVQSQKQELINLLCQTGGKEYTSFIVEELCMYIHTCPK